MATVVNDIVKLEWDKDGWLQTKSSKSKQGAFIMATKEYQNSDGVTIPVFFNTITAFIWTDDPDGDIDDIWSMSELKDWVKTEYSFSFPYNYDQYVPIIASGTTSCDEAVLEKYGLTEYKSDIEARLMDLIPYAEETEIKM